MTKIQKRRGWTDVSVIRSLDDWNDMGNGTKNFPPPLRGRMKVGGVMSHVHPHPSPPIEGGGDGF